MIPIDLSEGQLPTLGADTPNVLVDEGTTVPRMEVGQKQTVMFGPFSLEVEISGGPVERSLGRFTSTALICQMPSDWKAYFRPSHSARGN